MIGQNVGFYSTSDGVYREGVVTWERDGIAHVFVIPNETWPVPVGRLIW